MNAPDSVVTPEPTYSILLCPLDGCGWLHREEIPDVAEGTLAHVFGPGVMSVVAKTQHHERLEQLLENHFTSHKTEDYLRTITRLKGELARREAGS
jgi:hypothetical protein